MLVKITMMQSDKFQRIKRSAECSVGQGGKEDSLAPAPAGALGWGWELSWNLRTDVLPWGATCWSYAERQSWQPASPLTHSRYFLGAHSGLSAEMQSTQPDSPDGTYSLVEEADMNQEPHK